MNKGRIFFFLLMFPLLAHSVDLPDFDKAMGKGTTAWDCIRTPEDKRRIAEFKLLYNHYRNTEQPSNRQDIPKVLHWIWLGPKPFPQESLARMKQWIKLHPGWNFKLWTDQARSSLPSEVLVCDVLGPLGPLSDCYFNSDNFGEKSEVLRLAVLESEGGIYLDHDMEPVRSLDPLVSDFVFFCGLEGLKPTLLSSSVYPATSLIAASREHPILRGAIEWLKSNWDRLEAQFPGTDEMAVANRVKHRGFRALNYGVALVGNCDGSVVLPAAFFSESHPEKAIYAAHHHLATWLKKEETEQVRNAFIEAESEIGLPATVAIALGVCNLVLCAYLVKTLRSPSKKREAQ